MADLLDKQGIASSIAELENEHRDLNDIIDNPEQRKNFSEFTLQRLKKRKLHVKDRLLHLKSCFHPDIIA